MRDTSKTGTNAADSLFTIRNSLFGIVTVLVMIIMSFNIISALDASDQKSESMRAIEINDFSDKMLDATHYLSLERGILYTSLGFEGSAPSVFVGKIRDNHAKAVSSFKSALSILKTFEDFPRKRDMIKSINEDFDLFSQIQKKALQATALSFEGMEEGEARESISLEKREAGKDLRKSVDSLNSDIHNLRLAVEFELKVSNSQIVVYQQLKNALAVMSEYADREWGVIGASIASNRPLSQTLLDLMSPYNGRVEASWDLVRSLVNTSGMDPELKKQVEAVNVAFFEDFQDLRYEVYDASYAEEGYSVSAVEWIDQATLATKTILDLSKIAGKGTSDAAEVSASEATASLVMDLTVLAIALAIAGGAFWLVARRVVRPLNALGEVMTVLAGGNLEIEVRGGEKRDEIGVMSRALQVFKDAAIENKRLEEEQRRADEERRALKEKEVEEQNRLTEEERVREENRAEEAREERRQMMLDLADDFEASVMNIVNDVSSAASEMEVSAQSMSTVADQTIRQTAEVTAASEQASSNIQMVASAAEQLSASVKEISTQVTQSSDYSRNAVSETERANVEIQGLVSAAKKIGDVISLINDIAEQTNLLALNATIEAARAGEAGKGFAVVASEVKNLASQTATATDEIASQVGGMQSATEKAVLAISGIEGVIKKIDNTSVSISSSVEEQDASTHEIARNVSEVSAGTQEVTSNIHVVSEGAISTGKAASSVLESAQNMSQQSADLRTELEKFLQQIRAA